MSFRAVGGNLNIICFRVGELNQIESRLDIQRYNGIEVLADQ